MLLLLKLNGIVKVD